MKFLVVSLLTISFSLTFSNAYCQMGATGPGYLATSASSIKIGTGSFTFITQGGLAYLPNSYIRVSAGAADYMEGTVTSYSGTTLVMSEVLKAGSGTYSSWNISVAGEKGTAGAKGVTGPAGATGLAGATGNTGPTGTANAWLLNGNTGTVTGTNYIGTNDSVDLMIKINGRQAGIIEAGNNQSTSFGYQALSQEVSNDGRSNEAMGYRALYANTTGYFNAAIGFRALYANTVGFYNTATGNEALFSSIGGNYNTATGTSALYSNTNGSYNTAAGEEALFANTTGVQNTAAGVQALYFNKTGFSNTACGFIALSNNTTGSNNAAFGVNALNSNLVGNGNVAMGIEALFNNTQLSNQVAIGDSALFLLNGGTGANTAIGSKALLQNTAGNNNTAVGFHALEADLGSQNTAVGSGGTLSVAGVNNCSLIGYAATSANASGNECVIGNHSVISIGGVVAWTKFSDARIKDNIQQNVPGLKFINRLSPVSYHLNVDKLNQYTNSPDKDVDFPGKHDIEKITFSGFLAQDVDAAATTIGYDFSGVDKNKGTLLGLRYEEFIPSMVKSIQELSGKNDSLKEVVVSQQQLIVDMLRQNASLQNTNNTILSRLDQFESSLSECCSNYQPVSGTNAPSSESSSNITLLHTDFPALEQNVPNPFNQNTFIKYYIPYTVQQSSLVITDIIGRILVTIPINATGFGKQTIAAGQLASGTYNYTLILDNKAMDAKQMVLTR